MRRVERAARGVADRRPTHAGVERLARADAQVRRMLRDAAAGSPEGLAGPARAPVVQERLASSVYCPRAGGWRLTTEVVRRERGPDVLRGEDVSEDLRAAARAFAAAVEAAGSVRAPVDGPRGGVSDGGAVGRCVAAARLREMCEAVGASVVLSATGRRAAPDRGRRDLLRLDLVHAVCVRGASLKGVLRAHGWSTGPGDMEAAKAGLLGGLAALAVHLRLRGGRGA